MVKIAYDKFISFEPTTTATLVEAQMGSGKSYAAIRYALAKNVPIIVLTHRIALLGKTQADFAELGHVLETPYNRNRAFGDNKNHRACCIESTTKLNVPTTPFILLVDEIVDVLHHLIFAQLLKADTKQEILRKLTELVMSAKEVIFTSADADTAFSECLFREFPRSDWNYIQYVNSTKPVYEAVVIPTADKRSLVLANLVNACKQPGKSIWCNVNTKAPSTKKSPLALASFAKIDNTIAINATSLKRKGDPAHGIDSRINDTANYDAVFVSGAINSGVSVTEGSWGAVVTDMLSNVSVRQALQSAMRIRDVTPKRFFIVRRPTTATQPSHGKIEHYLKNNGIPFSQSTSLLLPLLTDYFVRLESIENADPFVALCNGLKTKGVTFTVQSPSEALGLASKEAYKKLNSQTMLDIDNLTATILSDAVSTAIEKKSFNWDAVDTEVENTEGLDAVVEHAQQATSSISLYLKEIADFLGLSEIEARMNAHKFKSNYSDKKVTILAAILTEQPDFIQSHILTSRKLKEYETQGIPFKFSRSQQYQIAMQMAGFTEDEITEPSADFTEALVGVVKSAPYLADIFNDFTKSDLSETKRRAKLMTAAYRSLGLNDFKIYTLQPGTNTYLQNRSVNLTELIVSKALSRKLAAIKETIASGTTIAESLKFSDAVKNLSYDNFISSDFPHTDKAAYVRSDRANSPKGRFVLPPYPQAVALTAEGVLQLLQSNRDELLFVDTETYHPNATLATAGKKTAKLGDQALCRRQNRIRLLQIATMTAVYYYDNSVGYTFPEAIIESLAKCKKLVFHNAVFDCSSLGQKHSKPGVVSLIKPYFDTLLALKTIYGTYTGTEVFKKGFNLKAMVGYLTGQDFPSEASSDWGQLFLTAAQIQYATNDVILTRLLYEFCVKALDNPFIVGNPSTSNACWNHFKIDCSGLVPVIMSELKGIYFNEAKSIKITVGKEKINVAGFRESIAKVAKQIDAAATTFKTLTGVTFHCIAKWLKKYDTENLMRRMKPKEVLNKLLDSGVEIPEAKPYKQLVDMTQYVMQLKTALLSMDTTGNIPYETSYCTGAGRSTYSSGSKTDGFRTINWNSLPRATRLADVPLPRYVATPPAGFKMADSDIGGSHLKIAIQLSGAEQARLDIEAGYDMHAYVGFGLMKIVKDLPQIVPFLPEMQVWLAIDRPLTVDESNNFARLAKVKNSIFDVCRQVGKLVYSTLNGGDPANGAEAIFKKNIPGDYSPVKAQLSRAFDCYGSMFPFLVETVAYVDNVANQGFVGDFKGTFFDSGFASFGAVFCRIAPTSPARRVMSKLLQGIEATIMRDSIAKFFAQYGSDDCYLTIVNHDSQAWVIKESLFDELALRTQIQMYDSTVTVIGAIDMGVVTEMPVGDDFAKTMLAMFPQTNYWA
jgi:hypothetical protein